MKRIGLLVVPIVLVFFLAGCIQFLEPQATISVPDAPSQELAKNASAGEKEFIQPLNSSFVKGIVKVLWRVKPRLELVRAEYSNDSGARWRKFAEVAFEEEGEASFDSTGLPDGTRLLLRLVDGLSRNTLAVVGNVTVDNTPPKADCGGPYESLEGGVVNVSAVNSTDVTSGIAYYEWAFNSNQFKNARGVNALLTPAGKGSFAYPLSVRVSDLAGNIAVGSCSIMVRNIPPSVNLSAVNKSREGEEVKFQVLVLDPGSDYGEQLSFKWLFGDGIVEQGSHLNTTHIYQTPGLYNATLYVSDGENDSSASTQINVSNVKPVIANLTHNQQKTGDVIFFWEVVHPPGTTISSKVEAYYFNASQPSWNLACTLHGRPYLCVWKSGVVNPGLYSYRLTVSDGIEPTTAYAAQNITSKSA